MFFNNEQLVRYSRQIILKEVGAKGQQQLLQSKVLVVGTGGLGSPAAMYLAAAGVGTIGLVDFDVVELSNLQRQVIHSSEDIGKAKVISGMESINKINPDIRVVTYRERIESENVSDIFRDKDYDFVIDCTDNSASKFLINDACVLLKKPFSHAGVSQFFGQTMTYVPGQGPCYRCVFPSPPTTVDAVPTCRDAGVLGVIPGIIGTIQATEAIKYLLNLGDLLTGSLLVFDALDMDFRRVKIANRSNCQVCGDNPTIRNLIDYELLDCQVKVVEK